MEFMLAFLRVWRFLVNGAARIGLLQVYTGDGKGKTTAAVGLALRMAGHGFRVYLLQFMKGDPNYGEILALRAVPKVEILQSGLPTFVRKGAPGPEDLRLARAGLETAREILSAGRHDLVILDEILCAVDYGLLRESELLDLIDRKPAQVELVLTGRNAPAEVIRRADLVSEIREVNHPYRRGVAAREGIEY